MRAQTACMLGLREAVPGLIDSTEARFIVSLDSKWVTSQTLFSVNILPSNPLSAFLFDSASADPLCAFTIHIYLLTYESLDQC